MKWFVMIIKRYNYHTIFKRLQEPRRFIQVIVGPRQVGKTTTIEQVLESYALPFHSVTADEVNPINNAWIEQQWEIARLKCQQSQQNECLLVIDEIQKIDNWSETVKRLWDEDTKAKRTIKVIVLGSSRLLIQQGLTESLAGRFETIFMGHWSFTEMKSAFGWNADQFVWFGGYPGSASLIEEEKRWKDYISNSLVETCISKDIIMLTRIEKPALMKRLYELGCLYSGQILSFNKMLGQLTDVGNTTTLSHYLELLSSAGLMAGLEKYSGNEIRKRSSSPKFQVFNNALVSGSRHETFQEIRLKPDQWGRMVESAIGMHLLNASISSGFDLYYWRKGNDEVDFVLKCNGKVVGLEVKSAGIGRKIGMQAFKDKFRPDKILLVGDGGYPWQEFLELDPMELF